MTLEWRPTDTGTCSRPRCREPAVAALNRGIHRFDSGRTFDAWWRYCQCHLADYGRTVRDGQVVSVSRQHGRPVAVVDTGGLL